MLGFVIKKRPVRVWATTMLVALGMVVSWAGDSRAATIANTVVSAGEMSGYSLLYAVNDGQFDFNDNYTTNNAGSIAAGSFDRVGYYVQLGGNWVWVSMDTFNTDPTKLGVPKAGTNILESGTLVHNLNIQSNHANLASLFSEGRPAQQE